MLHTAVEDMDNEPDLSDDLPELVSARAEPEAMDTANESQAIMAEVKVPLRHSTRESQSPRRLIEEL